jgi:hypothetical protein
VATSFSYLWQTSNGMWTVQSMGSEPVFGGACCGATFYTKEAAVSFLQDWGFKPLIGDQTWGRGA